MSLFRRVTRYRVSPTHNPQENRLTEITGAVLERVDGLAQHVMETVLATAAGAARERSILSEDELEEAAWKDEMARLAVMELQLRELASPRLRVRTQRTTKSGKFVDLELRLGPQPFADGDHFRFWIEVKHGAEVHGTQLTDYQADIVVEPADHSLVLVLAPRQSAPETTDVPHTVPVVEWQALAGAVRLWSRRPALSRVDRFLLDEYLQYLNEEGLMDVEVLTAEHAFVMSAYPQTEEAIAKLIEVADAEIQELWGPREAVAGGQKPSYYPGFWAQYAMVPAIPKGQSAPKSWRKSEFTWGFCHDGHRDESRNGYVFVAGVTFLAARDNPATLPANAEWLVKMQGEQFEYVSSYYWRLWRHLYLEELLVESNLTEQSARLASWVLESFRLLAKTPPPH